MFQSSQRQSRAASASSLDPWFENRQEKDESWMTKKHTPIYQLKDQTLRVSENWRVCFMKSSSWLEDWWRTIAKDVELAIFLCVCSDLMRWEREREKKKIMEQVR